MKSQFIKFNNVRIGDGMDIEMSVNTVFIQLNEIDMFYKLLGNYYIQTVKYIVQVEERDFVFVSQLFDIISCDSVAKNSAL